MAATSGDPIAAQAVAAMTSRAASASIGRENR
jgi:hypothetical protein